VIKIKIGVIGAGRWGKKHIKEYLKIKDVELAWVSDLSKENLNLCQEQYKIKNVTNNYTEVLNSDVEALSICTSNETHFEVCKDALVAGKHVLVEKPLTLDSKKAYELVNIAKKYDKTLAVGHIFRYNNAINEVKKLVENNFFGDLYYLRLQWTIQWMPQIYPDKQLDIIVDMMPHLYDIMNYLTGLWPKKITCFGKAFIKKDLEISWTLPEKIRQVDVIGQKACAKIVAIPQEVTIFENSNEGTSLNIKANNTLGDELRCFIDAVKNGLNVTNDGEIGAKIVELIEATRKSLKNGKTITL